jgi:hypothetical protein
MSTIKILAPIGLGELVDKISILTIKSDHVTDPKQTHNIQTEQTELVSLLDQFDFIDDQEFLNLRDELHKINQRMWYLEDTVRDCIADNNYGELFVSVAKDIPFTNDQRCAVKKEINYKFNSTIIEEKLYQVK